MRPRTIDPNQPHIVFHSQWPLSGAYVGCVQRAISRRPNSFSLAVIQHHNPHFTAIADLLKRRHNVFVVGLLLHNVITGSGIEKINKKLKDKAL